MGTLHMIPGVDRMRKEWKQCEIEFIKSHVGKLTYNDIGKVLNRTGGSIQHKAIRLGLVESTKWTKEETDYLITSYLTMPASAIAKKIGKSTGSVEQKARLMGLKKTNKTKEEKLAESLLGLESRKGWSSEEVELLKTLAIELSYEEIAVALDRTEQSVAQKANRLGIVKEVKKPNWSKEELDYLITNYATAKAVELLKGLPIRDMNSIYNKAYELGLKRETKLLGGTKPEIIMKGLLDSKFIKYKPQAKIPGCYYKIDYLIGDIAVEVHGDFWHCNPTIYTDGPFCSIQEINITKDNKKYEYLISNGYQVLVIWESELYDNPEACLEKVLSLAVLGGNT